MQSNLGGLFWHFLLLSCLSIGGLNTVMPDMHRYVVEEHALITSREFADVYAIAQAAPGPNALWVTLVGLQAGGWLGALATTLALFIPATSFSLIAVTLHARNPDAPFALALRRGLAPVAVGFMLASAWLLVRSADHNWQGYAITLLTVVAVLTTRLNPLILISAGALVGIAGFI